MTKTQMKALAQDAILHYSESAFYPSASDLGMTEAQRDDYMQILKVQRDRVAKFFGLTLTY